MTIRETHSYVQYAGNLSHLLSEFYIPASCNRDPWPRRDSAYENSRSYLTYLDIIKNNV